MTARRHGAALLLVACCVTACAETVVDDGTADTSVPAGTGASTAASPTSEDGAPTGSTGDLLGELSTAMASLSEEIIADGRTEQETLVEIDALWSAVSADIEATHPELVGNFEATIEMARTAVTRIRPADADKAYLLLNDLVATYTSDG